MIEQREDERKGRNVGYIVKALNIKPHKAWVFRAYTPQNKYIGQAFTLRAAVRKFEGRTK